MTQYILGIRPDYDSLIIDPCIPGSWKEFKIKRVFRGAIYNIEVKNPNHISKGINKIIVDGKEQSGNRLPVFKEKTEHDIIVILG